jgi:hypothetical protein
MLFQSLNVSFASAAVALIALLGAGTAALADPVKNIVLVHGAWVDGSGWKPVYESHPNEVAAIIEDAAQKSQN